jgi:hypothetical protein
MKGITKQLNLESKEFSDSNMLFNKSSKNFPALISPIQSADSNNEDGNEGVEENNWKLSSSIWAEIFNSFYYMKYSIFIEAYVLSVGHSLPFSDSGEDFNS